MRLTSIPTLYGATTLAMLVTACGGPLTSADDNPEFEGIFDFEGTALTDLSDQCDFDSGTVTLGLAAGDIGVMARNSLGHVTINGVQCGEATVSSVRQIVVEETSAGAQTLILDFLGGQFANGRSTGPGWDIDLGTGTDNLRIRGSNGVDRYTMGSLGIATNTDSNVDIAYANVESIVVSLGPGNDVFSAAGGTTATGVALTSSIAVYGGAGNDTLRGGAGDDELFGGEGNDTFVTGATADGADALSGGAGIDTADYSARTSSVVVTIDGNADDGAPGEGDNVMLDVENVIGGMDADDLTGSDENNVISGGPGNDTLRGGLGDDTLNGGAGDDTFDCGTSTNGADIMNGGTGIDTADYSARTASLAISLNGRADDGADGEGDNVRADVENVIGGSLADVIVGSSANNVLEGRDGDDTISGGAGNDVIRGGDGDDTLNGDAGNDTFDEEDDDNGSDIMNGGVGIDTVTYAARTASVAVTIGAGANDGQPGEGDDIGVTVENITGGAGDDNITGSDADNVIIGGDGDDILNGGAGADVISGGLGADTINGGAGEDSIDGEDGTDTLDCGDGDGDICLDPEDCAAATACEL